MSDWKAIGVSDEEEQTLWWYENEYGQVVPLIGKYITVYVKGEE